MLTKLPRLAVSKMVGVPPSNRILAGYGRREFSLVGQLAVSHEVDEEPRCKKCQMANEACVTVEQDRFWVKTNA